MFALGEICALLAAATWAVAVVLFKLSGERMPPLALNLFKNVVGLLLLTATLPFTGGIREILTLAPQDLWTLALSGLLGIALSDTLFFYALQLVGVGLVSIVDATYSPFAVLFAWLLLGEPITSWHLGGGALILGAVLVAAAAPAPVHRSRAQIFTGLFLGTAAMATMAWGIVIAKPVLEHAPLLAATTLRLAVGTLGLALLAASPRGRRQLAAAVRPSAAWRLALPAAVLGSYLAMVLWTAGFKFTSAANAALLNQTSIVWAILLAAPILGERLTTRKLLALALALAGVAVVVASA